MVSRPNCYIGIEENESLSGLAFAICSKIIFTNFSMALVIIVGILITFFLLRFVYRKTKKWIYDTRGKNQYKVVLEKISFDDIDIKYYQLEQLQMQLTQSKQHFSKSDFTFQTKFTQLDKYLSSYRLTEKLGYGTKQKTGDSD